MNINKILPIIVIIILGMLVIPNVILNNTGGISGLIKLVGVVGAILTFFKPKLGIYIITLETCYLDFFKKVGCYYGVASQLTVVEILSMSMLTIGLLWASMLIYVPLSRKRLSKAQVYFLIGIILYALLILVTGGIGVKAVQDITNGAGIFGIIMAITLYYDDPKQQMLKYTRHIVLILLPWPIYGLIQYYGDYSEMDYWYSSTGLSITNTPLEYLEIVYGFKCPIGFGSSQLNFGFVGFLYGICLWHAMSFKQSRLFYLAVFLVSIIAIFHTDGRTSMLSPLVVLALYFLIKSRTLFVSSIIVGGISALALIIFAEKIIDNLGELNEIVQEAFFFIEDKRRVTIVTLAARIRPLITFTQAENWSLFGVASLKDVAIAEFGDKYYSHNTLATVFFTTGIAGLCVIFGAGLTLLVSMLKLLYIKRDPETDRMIRFGVAFLVVILAMRFLLGSNYSTQPANIIATIPIGIMVCASIKRKQHQSLERNLGLE